MSRTLAILLIAAMPIYTLDWVWQSDHSCSCGSEKTKGEAGGCHSSPGDGADDATSSPQRGGCSMHAASQPSSVAVHSCCGSSIDSRKQSSGATQDGQKKDTPDDQGCGGRCVTLTGFVGVKEFVSQTRLVINIAHRKPVLMAISDAQHPVIRTLYRPLTRGPPQV